MLTLAREYRGLTQTALAKKLGVAQSIVSRFESGTLPMSEQNVLALSTALNFPATFFEQPETIYGLGASFLFHRSRQSLPVGELRRIEAEVNVARIGIARLLRGVDSHSEREIRPMEVGLDGTPEEIAQLVRAAWSLPSGPIANLTKEIEGAGGIVVRYPFAQKLVDGISLWVTGTPPLYFLNDNSPGDRDRWTLAHELGHIVMHRTPTKTIEDEANRFASEFLMPAKIIRPELQNMTLARAALLKLKWRVSMAALIRRAKDLEVITANQYRNLCMGMSKAGWRLREPNEIAREQSSNLKAILDLHQRDHGYTLDELGDMALCSRSDFQEKLVPRDGPRLRLAQ